MARTRRLEGAEQFLAASMTPSAAGPRLSLMRLTSFEGIIRARDEMASSRPLSRLTVTAIMVKILGQLLSRPQYQDLNSRIDQDTVITYDDVNIAIPVYRSNGGTSLIVIGEANRKSIDEISSELKTAPEGVDYSRATTMFVNLGVMGIDAITGISLPGVSTSLAVGRIRRGQIYNEAKDRVVTTYIAWVTMSVDPRAVGPDVAGSFLSELASVLESSELVSQLVSS